MFRIVYVSTATQAFSQADLSDLLSKAQARNAAVEVTGMLVYCNGEFLQALEGEFRDVIATFDRINADQRHQDIVPLQRGMGYGDRLFPGWFMGLKMIDGHRPIEGFIGVNHRIKLRDLDPISALDFLKACASSQ